MNDVLLVVVQREATMSQAQHPAAVGIEPGKESSAAGRARGGSTKRLAKKRAFLREALKIRGWYRLAVGRKVSSRVVRMNVDNIGTEAGFRIYFRAGVACLQGDTRCDHALKKCTP